MEDNDSRQQLYFSDEETIDLFLASAGEMDAGNLSYALYWEGNG